MPDANDNIPNFAKGNGLLPVVAQDAATGNVLMLAYMNREAFDETMATGKAVYFSRSRGKLWRKGEQSGHTQRVLHVLVDCDADTILLKVEQTGAACHDGFATCFYREITQDGIQLVEERLVDPKQVYGKPPKP